MREELKVFCIFKIESDNISKYIGEIYACNTEHAVEMAIRKYVPFGEIWDIKAVCKNKLNNLFIY